MKRYVKSNTAVGQQFDIDLTNLYLHLGGELPVVEDDVNVLDRLHLVVDGEQDPEYPYIDMYRGSVMLVADGETVKVIDNPTGAKNNKDGEVWIVGVDHPTRDIKLPIELARIVGYEG